MDKTTNINNELKYCEQCGKPYAGTGDFCSVECRKCYRSLNDYYNRGRIDIEYEFDEDRHPIYTLECDICGKVYKTKSLKSVSGMNFCSNDCRNEYTIEKHYKDRLDKKKKQKEYDELLDMRRDVTNSTDVQSIRNHLKDFCSVFTNGVKLDTLFCIEVLERKFGKLSQDTILEIFGNTFTNNVHTKINI